MSNLRVSAMKNEIKQAGGTYSGQGGTLATRGKLVRNRLPRGLRISDSKLASNTIAHQHTAKKND